MSEESERYTAYEMSHTPVDPNKCAASVFERTHWRSVAHQCRNRRKGDTEWCGQHSPEAVARRMKARGE